MPRSSSVSSSGGLIGVDNIPSNGGNVVTTIIATGTHTLHKRTTEFDVIVSAGGGGGGDTSGGGGGGGGAGGYRTASSQLIEPGSSDGVNIPITIGAGGGINDGAAGSVGNDSVFGYPANPITSDSGGYGGTNGAAGGAGGSGGGNGYTGPDTGGAGNTPPTSPSQGNPGGAFATGNGGGGGGGAGAAGGTQPSATVGGRGGIGAPSTITGTNTYYSGGGGASSNAVGGAGGQGGGGHGRGSTYGNAKPGTANTGGGGGGTYSGQPDAGTGGSGVVIIKEKDKASGIWGMKTLYSAKLEGQWPDHQLDHDIFNSLRFNPGDEDDLSITPGSAGNRRTFTLSFWAKISADYGTDTSTNNFFTARDEDGMHTVVQQISGGYLQAMIYDDTGGEGAKLKLVTNAAYRDVSAWYHIVFAVDTTQGTASSRAKLYVNGSQVTSFSTETYADQDFDSHMNNTNPHYVGSKDGTRDYFDGYLAEFHSIDGQQLHPGHFGEPHADSPNIWIPRKYQGTYGDEGFFLEFKQSGTGTDASGMGADTSGNTNHMAVNNLTATSQTTDAPTNNFCTMNPLQCQLGSAGAIIKGNLSVSLDTG